MGSVDCLELHFEVVDLQFESCEGLEEGVVTAVCQRRSSTSAGWARNAAAAA
jgi:hypothetical protein